MRRLTILRSTKNSLMTTSAVSAMLLGATASMAQTMPPEAPAQAAGATVAEDLQQPDTSGAEPEGGDIVVTGTSIVRDGYQAPTPVSVLGEQTLNAVAATNIADSVNRLPSLAASVTPRSQPAGISGGSLGVNQLNLRGLGPSRTLVLLDGRRIVNSSINTQFAAPDINNIPNDLVTRVDVVTGGASAVYGSDALAGVVNFVLDRKFTGIKGRAQGGISTYGDAENYLFSLTGGTSFANDRGHIVASGEMAFDNGVRGTPRPWNDNSASVIVNPNYTATNGLPYYLVARQVGLSNGTPGGLITAGPLRGVVFGPGGTPSTFNFGLVSINNVMSGGDWQTSRIDQDIDLAAQVIRKSAYGRASYELLDNVEAFGELQWARTDARNTATPNRRLGNLVIRADNPFIPAAIATRITELGLTSFTMGTTNGDIGRIRADNERTLTRWTAGLDGSFDAFGSTWKWTAYYQQSRNVVITRALNNGIIPNYLRAVDAVRSPTTGAIICRSTLTDPTNGCVPYNPMGIGVNSAAAIDYVTGTGYRRDVLKQEVAAANLRGEPFSTWAGPVSVAFGAEYRRESVRANATALDESTSFFTGNYRATNGSYNVKEVSFETVVPLAMDVAWARSLDLNAAVRATDYSTSGSVTTWKIGATYAPIEDIRFRATRSRDIRAPNLGELFSRGQTSSGIPLFDPFTNTQVSNTFALGSGNPVLQPEVANTLGLGVVFSPTFISGFQASVDFYKIDIGGAVAVPPSQDIVNRCFAGETAFCSDIERVNGVINLVVTRPANVVSQSTEGLDVEASYSVPLSDMVSGWNGTLRLRALATYVFSLKTAGVGDGAGIVGNYFGASFFPSLISPTFRATATATYDSDPLSVTVAMRHVGPGVYNNAFTACSSGCPSGTNSINDNSISANTLFDISASYDLTAAGSELFVAIDNVFNQDPPLIGGDPTNTHYLGQANMYYDRIGRVFRAGLRFGF